MNRTHGAFKIVLLMFIVAIGMTFQDYHHTILALLCNTAALGLAARWGVPNFFRLDHRQSMFEPYERKP